MPLRARVERASVPIVERLNRLPRVAAFLGVLALMVAGIFVPRVGWVFTLAVAAFLGWLLYLSWPRLEQPERLLRVAVLALVVAVSVIQMFPR